MEITTTELGLAARVQQLTKTYGTGEGQVRALDGVSVGIRRGEFTAIMGPSGSGKSTLMHIMAGLDAPTSGRTWIGDTDITGLSDLELTILRRRRVGFVFQAFNLVPTLDAMGNILLPFDLDGRRPSALERARIDGLVESLGLGSRLRHVHLCDGSGALDDSRVFDEHLVPGRGSQPVAAVLRSLATSGWSGSIVAEVNTRKARDAAERRAMLQETLGFAQTHTGGTDTSATDGGAALEASAPPATEPGPAAGPARSSIVRSPLRSGGRRRSR